MDLTGDIWSTGAFSFESPLKDLLETGNFTLEQLLAEDELLQELRGCHQTLIAYFSTEEAVTKLVKYVIMPQPSGAAFHAAAASHLNTVEGDGSDQINGDISKFVAHAPTEPGTWLRQHLEAVKNGTQTEPENDPALKHIRFPYMACEIICCEIPGVIDTLVEGKGVLPSDPKPATAEDEAVSDDVSPTSSVTEILTSESQGDMVEVVAKKADEASDNRVAILDVLFSLLHETPIGELDDYRAGYFDKILTVLFRKRPDELTDYINKGGAAGREPLIQSMLNHLYSHSIMQIAQRLLLPQRPVEQQPQQQQQLQAQQQQEAQQHEGDEIVAGDGDDDFEGGVQCDWGNSPEVLLMLLDTLIGPARTVPTTTRSSEEEDQLLDLSLNASEVLITIIQNSMLSSAIMLSLTSTATISRIVNAATTLPDPLYFSPHESLLTSAMNVLESLVLQLGGYGAVGTMSLMPEEELALSQQQQHGQQQQKDSVADMFSEDPPEAGPIPASQDPKISTETDADVDAGEEVGIDDKHLISDLGSMLDHLPRLLEALSSLLRHPSTKSWTSPTQFSRSLPQQLLGNSRLRIVRVLESLVLLGDPDIDSKLVQSDCLEICLDFFWEFQWCSMLHQSVANLLVHVFEGQNTRFEMQEYFLVKCNLLGRLMDSFVEGVATASTPRLSVTKLNDFVESVHDVDISAGQSSTESAKGVTSDGPLPISEDDVDAAMESQTDGKDVIDVGRVADGDAGVATPAAVLASTEAVRFESSGVPTGNDVIASPPTQTFRFGYMGHVIIICQALVHAYTNDPHDQELMDGEGGENAVFGDVQENTYMNDEKVVVSGGYLDSERDVINSSVEAAGNRSETDGDEPIGPKDDFGEPLLLFEIVHTHELAERWHEFVDTTLAAETAVQSTPLGGFSMQSTGMDAMAPHRPGLADEEYMMGDDGEGPPVPPRGMLGAGDAIDMDDNDLDIAASMMAGLSLGRSAAATDADDNNSESNNSGDSEKSYNSGETAGDKAGYAFDDPLGKAGGLGIELGKLTQYQHNAAAPESSGADDDSHSSSDEEPDSSRAGDEDVPVLDLFAGNFSYDQPSGVDAAAPAFGFADFADFDAAASSDGGDAFGTFVSTTVSAPLDQKDPAEDRKSAEIEEIFGKGDHAELLELEDSPQEDASSIVEPVSFFAKSSPLTEADSRPSEAAVPSPLEAVIVLAAEAEQVADDVIHIDQDQLQTAPSDELRADMTNEEKADDPAEDDPGR